MKEIKIIIENLKKITRLDFTLSLEKGLYAIAGNNGSGKSSLMTAIAKLVRPSILKEEFAGSTNNFSNSSITYVNPYGFDIVWRKNPNWHAVENYEMMPRYKGFFESSILTGTRFHHLDNKKFLLKTKDIESSKEASEFIKENLDYIINGTKTTHFDNLYFAQLDRENRLYFIQFEENIHISEFNLSTGEYFLLSVLKIIQTFSNRRQKDEIRLLIIDEIDIALHPLAQRRFIEKLKEWMIEYNLLIIFATHSLQIINSLKADDIYYIENNEVLNPIYPAYLTSRLFEHTSYDKVILVEDDLAKRFIEIMLDSINYERLLLKIIPIGGWGKVLEIYSQNRKFQYFGTASTLIVLDGDIISSANKKPYKNIKKTFLPFDNFERICVEKLFECVKFKEFAENKIYPTKIIQLNINEISDNEFKVRGAKTETIKKIFNKFIEEAIIYTDHTKTDMLNFIIKYIDSEFKTTQKYKSLQRELNNFLIE